MAIFVVKHDPLVKIIVRIYYFVPFVVNKQHCCELLIICYYIRGRGGVQVADIVKTLALHVEIAAVWVQWSNGI